MTSAADQNWDLKKRINVDESFQPVKSLPLLAFRR
jgi:hypothetical protein